MHPLKGDNNRRTTGKIKDKRIRGIVAELSRAVKDCKFCGHFDCQATTLIANSLYMLGLFCIDKGIDIPMDLLPTRIQEDVGKYQLIKSYLDYYPCQRCGSRLELRRGSRPVCPRCGTVAEVGIEL